MENRESYTPEDVARILLFYDRFYTNVTNGKCGELESILGNIPPNIREIIQERIEMLKGYAIIRSVPMD